MIWLKKCENFAFFLFSKYNLVRKILIIDFIEMPTQDPTSNGVTPATNSQAQTQNDEFDFDFIQSQDETPVEDQVSETTETTETDSVQEASSDFDFNLDLPDSYAGTSNDEKVDDAQSTLENLASTDDSVEENNPFDDSASEDSKEVDSLDSTEDKVEDKVEDEKEEDHSDDANLLDDSDDTLEDSSSLNDDLDDADDSFQDSSEDTDSLDEDVDSLDEDVVSWDEGSDDLLDDDLLDDDLMADDEEDVSDLDDDSEISDSDDDSLQDSSEDTDSLDEDVVDNNSEDNLDADETDEFSLVETSEEDNDKTLDEKDSSLDEAQTEDISLTDAEDLTSSTDDNIVEETQADDTIISEEAPEDSISDNFVSEESVSSEAVTDQVAEQTGDTTNTLAWENLDAPVDQDNSSSNSEIAVDSALFEAVGEELSNTAPQSTEASVDNMWNVVEASIQGQEMAQDMMSSVNQPVAEQSTPEQAMFGQPVAEQSLPEQPVVEQPVAEDTTPKTMSLDEMVSQFATANQNNQTLMENNNQISDQNAWVENQQGVSLDSLLQGAKTAEQAAAPQTLDLDAMNSQVWQANPLTAPTPYPQQVVNWTKAKSTNKTLVTWLLGLLVVVLWVMAYIKYPDMFNFSGGDNTPVAVSDDHGVAPGLEDLDSLTGEELTWLEEEYADEDELMIQMLEPVEIDETTLIDEDENIQSIDLWNPTEENVPSEEKKEESSGTETWISDVQELEIGNTSDNDPLAAVEKIGVSFWDSIAIKQELMDYQVKGKTIKESWIAETNKTKMKYWAAIEKEATLLLDRIENESDIDISSVWAETKEKLDNYLQLVENV